MSPQYHISISHLGKLRMGTKSDLLHCLESCIEADDAPSLTDTDVTILDEAVVVNSCNMAVK